MSKLRKKIGLWFCREMDWHLAPISQGWDGCSSYGTCPRCGRCVWRRRMGGEAMGGEWQKCPVCSGTGLVSRPPWVAGDQQVWAGTSFGPYPCKACDGIGMVLRPGHGR